MNNIILNDKIKIEDMIYEIKGVQVILASEISATKCHELFIKKGIISNE